MNIYIKLIFSFFFGAIGILSFSPYDFWPAAYLSISGLLFLNMHHFNTYKYFLIGYFWGLGFFGFGINWIYISIYNFSNVSYFISTILILILILYLSFYPALFTFFQYYISSKNNFIRLVITSPVIWHVVEFLRGKIFTGFPWLQLGYTQIDGPLKGFAPLFGVEFITFLLIFISGLSTYVVVQKKYKIIIVLIFLWTIPLLIKNIDWYRLQKKSVNIVLVQGNVPQSIKWNKLLKKNFLNNYLHMSFPYMKKNTIIIWPESAIPLFEYQCKNFFKYLNNYLINKNVSIITGILSNSVNKKNIYNSILVLGSKKTYNFDDEKYNKHHLVPFGEFIPLKKLLKLINKIFSFPYSTFSRGKYTQTQLNVLNYKLTAAICYEIIFKNYLLNNFKTNSDFIINISNDAWFGNSIGPWQHFQIARMRALELGRPLLRSTNNGITVIIEPNGKIKKMIPQFISSVLKVKINPAIGITPYVKFGNIPLIIIIFVFTFIITYKKIKK